MVRGKRATWFLRAAAPADTAHAVLQVEGEQGAVSQYWVLPSQATRGGPGTRTALGSPAAFRCRREAFEKGTVSIETPSNGTDEGGDQPGPGAKRRQVEQRVTPKGVELVAVAGDGDCLLHSLAEGIAWCKGVNKKPSARALRAEIVSYMKRKAEVFAPFWDGCSCGGQEGEHSTFEEYRAEAAVPGKYLGNLELEAATRLFDACIYVIPDSLQDVPVAHGAGGTFPIALRYTGDHYDYFRPVGSTYPAEIMGIQEVGSRTGGRGGGADDGAGGASEASGYTAFTTYTTVDGVRDAELKRNLSGEAEEEGGARQAQ
jgi:hypothetical protein